jgi:type IV pilus assembly protein PilC
MAKYAYRALNKEGKEIFGIIQADSQALAINDVRSLGLYPTQVREARKSDERRARKEKKGLSELYFGGVKTKELVIMTRQLSTLIDAGLPLLRSMNVLIAQQKPCKLRDILRELASDIQSGSTFSEGLAKHPKQFDRLFVNMVRAGEVGGMLEVVLQRIATFMERRAALARRVKGAMIYPIAVLLIAAGIVAFLLVKVVPVFAEIFEEFGGDLPAPTKFLMACGDFMVYKWWLLLVVISWTHHHHQVPSSIRGVVRRFNDRVALKMPLIGDLVTKVAVARFARTLGTLITSGVPILQALKITRDHRQQRDHEGRGQGARQHQGRRHHRRAAGRDQGLPAHGGEHDRRRRRDRQPRRDVAQGGRHLRRGSRGGGRGDAAVDGANDHHRPRRHHRLHRHFALPADLHPRRQNQRYLIFSYGIIRKGMKSTARQHKNRAPRRTEMKRSKRGFTLVELLVVMAIISILASIVVPNVINYIRQRPRGARPRRHREPGERAGEDHQRLGPEQFEPVDSTYVPGEKSVPTAIGVLPGVAHDRRVSGRTANLCKHLLRSCATVAVPCTTESPGVADLRRRGRTSRKLSTSYIEIGFDPWGSLFNIYPGPWPANNGPVPFRKYRSESSSNSKGAPCPAAATSEDSPSRV